MKRLLSIALAAIILFAVSGCSGSARDDKLIIGLDDEFPPMGFVENGELVGFDVDLARAVGEKMGVEVEFQTIDWSAKEIELQFDKVDVLWNGLTIDEERKQSMDFTEPYLDNRQIIIVRSDSDINSKSDLEGREIGVQEGSTAVKAVEKDEIGASLNMAEYAANLYAFNDLDIGRIDAVVADEVVARYYLAHSGKDFRVLENDSFGDEKYGVAVKKGNTELRDRLQKAIDEIDEDGTAGEISKQWFGEDIFVHRN
jgi:polar amino acid transport system substrate-binding protein